MRLSKTLATGLLMIAVGGLPVATASEFSKFLHATFDNQFNRPPSGVEMNYYANVARTSGPLEAHIQMVSSDDYFVVQCQRRADVFVIRLYQVFLYRDPQPEEQRFWLTQFLQRGVVDRTAFVREFCQANNLVQVPSAPLPYQNTFTLPASDVAAAETLVAKVDLLRRMIEGEMGGTRYGRNVLEALASLLSTSVQFRDTVSSVQTTGQQRQIAADNLGMAWQRAEMQVRAVPAMSAPVQNLMWEISQLVMACRPRPNLGAPLPAPVSPIVNNVERLSSALRQYVALVATVQNTNPYMAGLYRDVNGLWLQTENLRQSAQAGLRQGDLQRMVNDMLTQSRTITRQVTGADIRLRQGWWNVQHELDQLSVAAGCGGDLYVAGDHPVIINRPAWTGFPAELSPGYQVSASNQRIVSLADQLLAVIDGYIDSLRPVATTNPEAARMINDTLDLRNEVLVVRQKAAAGAFGSQLQYAARAATQQYRNVASQTFLRMVGRDATLNSPTWVQIGELAYQIDKSVGS